MIDRAFFAVLTFSMLAAGTLAIASDFIDDRQAATAATTTPVVLLPTVEITGRRLPADLTVADATTTEPAR